MSIRLDPLFSDHMVLAAGKPIRVWGPGEGEMTVTLNGVSGVSRRVTTRDGSPRRMAELPAMREGGPYELTVTDGSDTLTLHDVYVGRVYLLSGQSNMQFKLRESPAEDPGTWHGDERLRLFTLDRIEDSDRWHAKDGWIPCRAEDCGDWSAIGWHMGRLLTRELGCAVGLVACYQGASVIESWLPEEICALPALTLPPEAKFIDHFYELYAAWNGDAVLYHRMFEKLIPFGFSAVLWYQGESDCSNEEAAIYADELCAMIRRWREDLSDASLPFVIIQIADFIGREAYGWRAIQEAQEKAAVNAPHAVCVRCADICENFEIHPRTKSRLGRRLADTLKKEI